MARISDLIGLDIKPEDQEHRKEKVKTLSLDDLLVYAENAQLARKYEFDVFNFLLKKKDILGIETVFKFENLYIDGAILLADGKTRLAVEIKMRMNWTKACQTGWQLKHFMTRTKEAETHPVDGAIVFFEEFQGDGWHVKADCRLLQNGWNHWYEYHSRVERRRVDLFRVCRGEIEHYGSALAASRVEQVLDLVRQLPAKEKREMLQMVAASEVAKDAKREQFAEDQLRHLCAARGLNWDALSPDEREKFIDDLIHEDRPRTPDSRF